MDALSVFFSFGLVGLAEAVDFDASTADLFAAFGFVVVVALELIPV